MARWSYQSGEKPAIKLINCHGDLAIEGWDELTVEITADSDDEELHEAITQHDENVQIEEFDANLRMQVPRGAWIEVEEQDGTVSIKEVAAVRLATITGDVQLRTITGDVEVEALGGNLLIKQAGHIARRESIAGDARISDTSRLELEEVGGNLQVSNVPIVVIDRIEGDAALSDIGERCQLGSVAGDLALHDTGPVNIRQIRGDLVSKHTRRLEVAEVDGDCTITSEEDATKLGDVHGNLQARIEEGPLQVGQVRGDATIKGAPAGLELGSVRGNLTLQLEPTATNTYRANVAGDAVISFPTASNLTVQAVVKGDILGLGGAHSHRHSGVIHTVLGSGDARLELTVGGNLVVRGAGSVFSSTWGPHVGVFSEEMAQLGKDLAETGREIAASFAGTAGMWAGKRPGHRAEREAERAARQAERKGERAARHARHAAPQLDPEQLERIRRQAREAAEAGMARAQQAVEQALRQAGIAGARAHEEARRAEQGLHESDIQPPPPQDAGLAGPATGQTVRLDQGEGKSTDEERLAILRMLEEGRITPEEAEQLLAALDGTAAQ
jgi:DUF4097 and DUF4098 domain-containing protein YvlB